MVIEFKYCLLKKHIICQVARRIERSSRFAYVNITQNNLSRLGQIAEISLNVELFST